MVATSWALVRRWWTLLICLSMVAVTLTTGGVSFRDDGEFQLTDDEFHNSNPVVAADPSGGFHVVYLSSRE